MYLLITLNDIMVILNLQTIILTNYKSKINVLHEILLGLIMQTLTINKYL